jgi:GTP-binding protein HflX
VLVEDRLFATLDATTRRLQLPGGEAVLLTDTVGFVRKLPHQLVESFKSTLEVASEADLLVHVVDGSAPDPRSGHIDAVRRCWPRSARLATVPELLCFNKADVAVGDRLRALVAPVDLEIPYDRGDLIAAVHRSGEVLSETPGEHSMRMRARLEASEVGRFEQYQVPPGVPAAELN